MRKNTLAKKLIAGLLTGTMLMSMGMNAFAETTEVAVTTGDVSALTNNKDQSNKPNNKNPGLTTIDSVPLKKIVLTDGKTYAPDTQFTFEIKPGEPGNYKNDGKTYPVKAGPNGGVTVNNPERFSSDEELAEEYSRVGELVFNISAFKDSGVYSYILTEKNTGYEGVGYSSEKYVIYVFVEKGNDGKFYIAAVTATKDGDTNVIDLTKKDKASSIVFTNNYGKEDREDDYVYDLIVTKKVSGNQGESSREFRVTIKINNNNNKVDSKKYYAVKYMGDDEESGTEVPIKNGSVNITLKDGESIHIYGLTENDVFKIDEEDLSKDGYTVTYEASDEITVNGKESVRGDYITGNLTKNGGVVTIINSKNITTPTGIAMTFAPYAVMVVCAGVFAVMFLRRKKEDY